MSPNHPINLESRTLALLGQWKLCKYFYLQFSSLLQIKYVFTTGIDQEDFVSDSFFADNQTITCMPLKDSLIKDSSLLLILCVEHGNRGPYDTLLFHRGYEWGTDYIDSGYVVQYYRRRDRIDPEEKNIWIFGAGNNGKFFYETYRNVYHICGFVSNFDREKECRGLPVIRPEHLPEQKNRYVVICSDASGEMAEILCRMGLRGNLDYGFEPYLPKKLFIAAGSCQIIKVAEFLCENKNFSSRYHSQPYFDNTYEPCSDGDNRRLKGYGSFCDGVLYGVTGIESVEFRNFAPLIGKFYRNAVKFHMPFYYFKGQLMQATNGINPYALKPCQKGYLWFRGDQEINRMAENNLSEEEILERILDEHYWSEQEIQDNLKRELQKVGVLDRFSSFSIRPFIEAHYREMQIFIDGTHFGYQLCTYLANQIAERLNIEAIDGGEMKKLGENPTTGVMPVYPCVRRALAMETEDSYQFYYVGRDELCRLDFKEYMRRYIRYVACAREMYGEVGTVMAW